MSKRSSRRKRREKKKQKLSRVSGTELVERGQRAFQQADYDTAIAHWEDARRKQDTPPSLPAALAEAYFRRAMHSPIPSPVDLKRAVNLQSDDPRYTYHLALAHHRRGDLDQAEPLYRRLLDRSPPFARAAAPLVQLILERNKSPLVDPAWEHLDEETQVQLAAADALIREKATSTLRRLAEEPHLQPLWRGFLAIALKDDQTATQALQAALNQPNGLARLPRGVAHYGLGLLAAQAEQFEQALDHWNAARVNGLDTPHLQQNQTALANWLANQALEKGQTQKMADLLAQADQDIHRRSPEETRYQAWSLGYAAAQQGDWATAMKHWQKAEWAGEDDRKLILNLALAYQHTENYWEAAEYWRQLLRRRPRKADHPDALNDEQVARLWQHVAENYNRAGDTEEAIKTYKNAIKWAPDNLALRLQLVETYQIEGRWQAAENEIDRILDKNPDYVPALTLRAEMYGESYYSQQAIELWQRILELEPQHPTARPQLANLYIKQSYNWARWGDRKGALTVLKEGLAQVPESTALLLAVGSFYAEEDDYDQTRHYFEQALAHDPYSLKSLYLIYLIYLQHDWTTEAQQIFARLKDLPPTTPAEFFLDLALECYNQDRDEEAEALLTLVEDRYPDNPAAMVELATAYSTLERWPKAVSVLRRLLQDQPDHAMANLRLGTAYFYLDQKRLAKRHWNKAETQAKKENDQALLYELRLVRDRLLHGKKVPSSPVEFLQDMPPEMLDELLRSAPPEVADLIRNTPPELLAAMMNAFGGLDDFDDFDDDEFFDPEDFF